MSIAAIRLHHMIAPLAVAANCVPALADFVPLSRHSIITVDTQRPGQPTTHSENSLDTFAPFNASLSSSIFSVNQNSSITASTASVTTNAAGGVVMPGNIGVVTYSEFTFVFDLQVPGSYTLTGQWSASGSALVRLSGPSGTFTAPSGDFNLSGALLPGQYTFQVVIGPFQSGGADVNALLTVVPVPAAPLLAGLAATGTVRRRSRPRF